MDSCGTVESFEKQLSTDPYDAELYMSLIDACIENAPDKVEEVRNKYRAHLLPTVEFWLNWLTETVLDVQKGMKGIADVENLFHVAMEDCPDRAIASEYVDIMTQFFEAEAVSEDKMREVFEQAVAVGGLDIMTGGEIWKRYRDFELDELEDLIETQSPVDTIQDAKRRLLAVIRKMLTHPLLGNDTALAELDDLLADVCVESDVNIINPSALSAAFVAGVEAREGRMVFEDNVTSSEFGQASVEDREKGWRAYIAFEIKDNQLFRAQRIYDRAVLNCPQSHFLWRQYIHFASDTVKNVNLLDTVTHRAIRVRPDCTADVDIWRLRFLAIELSSRLTSKSTTTTSVPTASSVEIGPTAAPCSASSNGAACSSDGQSELPALVYSALQTAMGCSFSATDDYLTIMKIYCDTFRRSLSKVVAVGAIAVDIISYISSLQAALDFIENYLWTYFDSWAEGWVLYALYRCRIEDGVIEDISCSVDGDINGTPILSRATDVWERLLGSKHGKNYVVWKAALSWAIACRKESDYIRKLFKKAVVTLDGTPVNYVHIDVMSCGPSAVTYNAYLTECPLDTVYGLWVAYEEEFGSTESAQQIVNRRYRALGGQQGRVNRRGPAPASQDSTRATQPVGTTTAHAGFAQQTMAQRKKGKTDRGDRSGGTESGHKKRALVESAAAGSGDEPIDSGKVSKKARKGNHISPTAAEVETVDSSRDGNSAANSTVDVDVGAASNGTANTARNDKHSVFVKNLAFSAKENDIRTVFEDCGALIAVELLTNTLGKSKGMAYVHFATAAAAEKALFKHNTAVAGRPITVESFRGEVSVTADGQYVTPTETFHPTTIFVTKLPREKEVTEDDVRACFAGAVGAMGGLIEACKVVKDKRSGHCKGHALVQFTNRECVKYCMENKTAFKIQDKAVHVGLSKFPVLESKEKPPPNKYLEEAKKIPSASIAALRPRGLRVKTLSNAPAAGKANIAHDKIQDASTTDERNRGMQPADDAVSGTKNDCQQPGGERKTNADFRALFQ